MELRGIYEIAEDGNLSKGARRSGAERAGGRGRGSGHATENERRHFVWLGVVEECGMGRLLLVMKTGCCLSHLGVMYFSKLIQHVHIKASDWLNRRGQIRNWKMAYLHGCHNLLYALARYMHIEGIHALIRSSPTFSFLENRDAYQLQIVNCFIVSRIGAQLSAVILW